jgi:hypothetical protein
MVEPTYYAMVVVCDITTHPSGAWSRRAMDSLVLKLHCAKLSSSVSEHVDSIPEPASAEVEEAGGQWLELKVWKEMEAREVRLVVALASVPRQARAEEAFAPAAL